MSNETFSRYDTADYLKTEDDIAAYLDAVMEEGGDDTAYVARALGVVARACARIAAKANSDRQRQ